MSSYYDYSFIPTDEAERTLELLEKKEIDLNEALERIIPVLWHLNKNDQARDVQIIFSKLMKYITPNQENYFSLSEKAIEAWLIYAESLINLQLIDEAIKVLKEIIPITRLNGYARTEALLLNRLGAIIVERGDLQLAQEYFQEAAEAAYRANDSKALVTILNNLANIRLHQGYLNDALLLYEDAERLAIKNNDTNLLSILLNNIGIIFRQLGELERSYACLTEALRLKQEIKDPIRISETLKQLVILSLEKNDIDAAEQYLQELTSLSHSSDNILLHVRKILAEAEVELFRGNLKNAEKLFKDAIELSSEYGFEEHITSRAHLIETLFYQYLLTKEKYVLKALEKEFKAIEPVIQTARLSSVKLKIKILQLKIKLLTCNCKEEMEKELVTLEKEAEKLENEQVLEELRRFRESLTSQEEKLYKEDLADLRRYLKEVTRTLSSL